MPNPILFLNKSYVFNGLGTLTHTISTAGLYYAKSQTTVPSAVAGGSGAGSGSPNVPPGLTPAVASGVVITVTQNGSTVYTSPTLSPTQNNLEFKTQTPLNCAANDVINIVITSSTASDQGLSGVKTVASIGQGI